MSGKAPFTPPLQSSAFTLAEVLITLVIIGVIAAMTIPNIIYENKKQEYSARLKKFYSTMKQVEQRAAADGRTWGDFLNGNVGVSGVGYVVSFQDEYLLPFISYIKTSTEGNKRYIYLNDGSYFSMTKSPNCFQFYYDVNGDKQPNEQGRDIYVFEYCHQNYSGAKLSFIPFQPSSNPADIYSREKSLSNCISDNRCCSAILMLDGWEFKSDYPYRL